MYAAKALDARQEKISIGEKVETKHLEVRELLSGMSFPSYSFWHAHEGFGNLCEGCGKNHGSCKDESSKPGYTYYKNKFIETGNLNYLTSMERWVFYMAGSPSDHIANIPHGHYHPADDWNSEALQALLPYMKVI